MSCKAMTAMTLSTGTKRRDGRDWSADSRGDLAAGEGTQGRGDDFVTGQRSDTVMRAVAVGEALERTATLDAAEASRRLRTRNMRPSGRIG